MCASVLLLRYYVVVEAACNRYLSIIIYFLHQYFFQNWWMLKSRIYRVSSLFGSGPAPMAWCKYTFWFIFNVMKHNLHRFRKCRNTLKITGRDLGLFYWSLSLSFIRSTISRIAHEQLGADACRWWTGGGGGGAAAGSCCSEGQLGVQVGSGYAVGGGGG
jgi:hypothetical protein